jgi:hypothetical protein
METFNCDYWTARWEAGETGWDLGAASPPLKIYIDQLQDLSARILIPGCGNSYEAEYLFDKGFRNTHLVDISALPLTHFQEKHPQFPVINIHQADFFDLTDKYDLILEQTFFCALDPSLRIRYAEKMYSLLTPNGRLSGLLFDDKLNADKPPFGGSEAEYRKLFEPYFHIIKMEKSIHSIAPRLGRELFFMLSPR